MMLFFDGQYPNCAAFIRSRVIGMHPLHHVFRAMVECIEDEELVKSAMSPGTYPRIVIEDLRYLSGSRMEVIRGIYQGECRVDKLNHVDLDIVLAEGLEDDPNFTSMFEHILLHETVHWGRFIAKKPSRIDGKEAGSWFEHLAFNTPFKNHHEIPCS